MRIHHLNCISTCPAGGRLMDGRADCVLCRGRLACHCLLLETNAGLVLVDTGLGAGDVQRPRQRLSWFFLSLLSPDFRMEMTAVRQVEQLGYSASDVRHIVLTHLDFDHAGGLDDFPAAKIHLLEPERTHAVAQETWLDRQRFRPQQWSSAPRWSTYHPNQGESWFGFEGAVPLADLGNEVVLVPLFGHTLGHVGVAVNRGDRWLLQAGDAYFYHREMEENPFCTPGLRFYQWLMEKDRSARFNNQARLRELKARRREIDILCSHDLTEFQRYVSASA
jgi:glyoxylase-like metal-dependent hydrolase (beta-lactamase superfamily II)